MEGEWKKKGVFPKKPRTKFYLNDLGGIGEMTYRSIRYKTYDFDNKNTFTPVGNPIPMSGKDVRYITGQGILVSLCQLAYNLNKETSKEKQANIIADWCVKNMHPFDIDDLFYNLFEKDNDESYDPNEHLLIDECFLFDDFKNELFRLYLVVDFYNAFKSLEYGHPERAYHYNYKGCMHDLFDWFEIYKNIKWKKANRLDFFNDDMSVKENIIKENSIKKVTIEKFKNNVLNDSYFILSYIDNLIPEIKMLITYDYKTKKSYMKAKIHSVFDIAWYTFARYVALNTPMVDEDLQNENIYSKRGVIGNCLNCGITFIKNNNRQIYCDNPDCQRARLRKNQNDYRAMLRNGYVPRVKKRNDTATKNSLKLKK